jgi:ATP-dependent helicase/nuclease subunit A
LTSEGALPDAAGRLPDRNTPLRDGAARTAAVDPGRNVVLEASAGTGKTRVLVDRYLNLLRAGVEPVNILAMTFTRKAASEMRQRILRELRDGAARSPDEAARWRGLRDRLNEIAVSTIDAFCLSLLREFPLEADLSPGFEVADETEIPRLSEESLDRTIRICRRLGTTDPDIALVFAKLGEPRLRKGLAALLERRLVAGEVLRTFLDAGPRDITIEQACDNATRRLRAGLSAIPGGLERFLSEGPDHPRFFLLAQDIRACVAEGRGPAGSQVGPSRLRDLLDRVHEHFFTLKSEPRKRIPGDYPPERFASPLARKQHLLGIVAAAPAVGAAILAYRRDLNVVLSRGVSRMFAVATGQYERTLDTHGMLDFSGLLAKASLLLSQMDEFAQSRYRLESRYHHILVDEFQDTSRAQWSLVSHLIRSWGEGFGLAHEAPLAPSIFVVGDRKQSIYGFRDADVALLDTAADAIASLRPDGSLVQSIAHSFRAVPALLAFANDVFEEVEKTPYRPDGFRYDARDMFPLDEGDETVLPEGSALGIIAAADPEACAAATAEEIARLARTDTVHDRETGLARRVRPADIAILFRSRESHRLFETALQVRGIPTYVYKGLGFFDADEIKDVVSLIRYLADPASDLRAAAFLRSRFVRLSDVALQRIAPRIALGMQHGDPDLPARLDDDDRRVIERLHSGLRAWLPLIDRVPPSELLDRILSDTAYEFELRGPGHAQARENLKKIRSIVRRIQNRGYLTFGRLSDRLDRLSAGDESNASVDAIDAVSLMTVHAAKGLEFPIVFVVNLSRGTGGARPPIRVASRAAGAEAVAVGDFESEADQDATLRDGEESKRLLYVAVTRARERLYLGSAVGKDGLRTGGGGLGDVLPDSVRALFERACLVREPADVEWVARSGRRHRFRVCPPPSGAAIEPGTPFSGAGLSSPVHADASSADDDFAPLADRLSVPRVAATSVAAGGERERPGGSPPAIEEVATVGILVHRLFQLVRSHEVTDHGRLSRIARALMSGAAEFAAAHRADRIGAETTEGAEPRVDAVESLVTKAIDLFTKMRSRPEVAAVLDLAECVFEVPISVRLDDDLVPLLQPKGLALPENAPLPIVRGVIDCLARLPDGSVRVIDFKTGPSRPADRVQLAIYLRAAVVLFPGQSVKGLLVYPDRTVDA